MIRFVAKLEKRDNVNIKVELPSSSKIWSHDNLIHRDFPDQHPISAITGLEEALQRADTFVYEQGIASSEWTINHNLNKYPSVTVVDSAGNEVIAEVNYPSVNTCVVIMTAAFKGKAYLN